MKKIILYVVFSFLVLAARAQQFADKEYYLVDSLVLDDINDHDQNILDSILPLYHNTDSDTLSLSYIEKLITGISDDHIWPKYNEILLNNSKNLVEQNPKEGNFKSYHSYLGTAYGNKAYLYAIKGDNTSALVYYNLAIESFVIAKDDKGQGVILSFLSIIYQRNGDIVQAIETTERSIDLIKNEELSSNTMSCYYNMVSLQANIGNYTEAAYYNSILLDIAKKTDDSEMIGMSISLQASFLLEQARYNNAKKKVIKAYNVLKNSEEKNYLLKVYEVWTEVEIKLENWEEAIRINNKLDTLSSDLGNVFDIVRVNSNRLEIYFKLGDYALAKKYGVEALNLLEAKKSETSKVDVLKYLAKIAQIEGDYKLANGYLEEKGRLKDLVFSDKVKNQGAKQVIQFKFDKQKEIDDLENQQKIALIEQEKKRTSMSLIFAVILAGIISLVSIFIFKQKKELDSAYAQLEESKKNELAVSNLKALQSQMNPHFIFNALNSVQDLVLLQDIRNSNKYLGKFSDLIRKILLSSKEQFISLAEEVEILSLYLDLEKLRFGKDFEIDLECTVSEEKQDEIKLPAMFIQPYIENAIKHGLFHKQGLKKLKVYFNLIDEKNLQCIVEDNGIGQKQAAIFKEKRLHLHTGFSTEAINERIRLLNETLDKKIKLEVVDLTQNSEAIGTRIILLFPV